MPYNFTQAQRIALASNAPGTDPKNGWEQAEEAAKVKQYLNMNISSVDVQVFKPDSEPASIATLKLDCLKLAIKGLQRVGLMFDNSQVKDFRVTLYGGDGGVSWESRGVVWFDDPDNAAAKPSVLLQLGSRVCLHVVAGNNTHAVAAGGAQTSPARIVADRIYDYYKGARSVSENERCALAQIYHEFGHIFHQLVAPSEYWLGSDVFGKAEKHNDLFTSYKQVFAAATSQVRTAETVGKAYVSEYAGNGQLNEFVAEVFSGLMMGVDWNAVHSKVMRFYAALNGPSVSNPQTLSRMNDFISQRCQCPRAGTLMTPGDSKRPFTRI